MENTQPKVVMYTTQTCGYCKMAKAFFSENNISFEEYDVGMDAQKRQEMFDKSHQMGVPVITVGDSVVIGFDKPRLSELLGLS